MLLGKVALNICSCKFELTLGNLVDWEVQRSDRPNENEQD